MEQNKNKLEQNFFLASKNH